MRIALIPTDTWGVGSYRVLFPGRELEKRGHDVFVHLDRQMLSRWDPRGGNAPLGLLYDFDKRTGRPTRTFDADSYVFQRRMDQISPPAIRQLRRCGKHVVVELDDNYDVIPLSSPGLKALRKYPDRLSIDWLNDGVRFASQVVVSTPALAHWYSRYNDNVAVIPNYLDWDMWRDVTPQYEVERERVRIGWMGWLEWRNGDLEILRGWMSDWLRAHPDVEFVSIGERRGNAKALRKADHVSVHDYLGVPAGQRVTVKARRFTELAKIVPHIDIGLVPLLSNEFNEAKSYLKGLEYAACGIPAVASPSQQYREFVRDGVDGFLAASGDEWQQRLTEMVADDGLRRRMGAAARAKAETLTIQKHWRKFEAAWCGSTSAAAPTASKAGPTLITA